MLDYITVDIETNSIKSFYCFFPFIDTQTLALQATYESSLTKNSSKYIPACVQFDDYYYEAIKVNVAEDGNYTLVSDSKMDTYGYLYEHKFNPFNPSANRITQKNNGICKNQFQVVHHLQKPITYILVVTTFRSNITGPFSIYALGPNKVTLKYIGKYTIDGNENGF